MRGVEFLSEIFRLIEANESLLSGIAASIVILDVLSAAIRQLIGRGINPGDTFSSAGAAELTAQPSPSISPPAALHTDSPSIAVMPFANLSGDPEQDFLADGLTEDIIFGLSRVKQLFVIARNTCFTYKGSTHRPDQRIHELCRRSARKTTGTHRDEVRGNLNLRLGECRIFVDLEERLRSRTHRGLPARRGRRLCHQK